MNNEEKRIELLQKIFDEENHRAGIIQEAEKLFIESENQEASNKLFDLDNGIVVQLHERLQVLDEEIYEEKQMSFLSSVDTELLNNKLLAFLADKDIEVVSMDDFIEQFVKYIQKDDFNVE